MLYVLLFGIPIVLAVVLTNLSLKAEKKDAISQLDQVLHILGKENESNNIYYDTNARWKGQINGKNIELQYFVNFKVNSNYLYIKTPYKTKTIFYFKNVSISTPFGKQSFNESNEICLNYIKNERVRNQLINLLNDIRFCGVRTRMNSYESRFVKLPEYGENQNVINAKTDKETDVLSIMLARPGNDNARSKENDFNTEFLFDMIKLLHDIKAEL